MLKKILLLILIFSNLDAAQKAQVKDKLKEFFVLDFTNFTKYSDLEIKVYLIFHNNENIEVKNFDQVQTFEILKNQKFRKFLLVCSFCDRNDDKNTEIADFLIIPNIKYTICLEPIGHLRNRFTLKFTNTKIEQ